MLRRNIKPEETKVICISSFLMSLMPFAGLVVVEMMEQVIYPYERNNF